MRSPALSSLAVVFCAVVVMCAAAAIAQQPTELEWRDGKWQPIARPATDTPQGYLVLIRRYYDTARYGAAVAAADTFLKRYPDDPAGEEVMLIAGEAQLNRQLYFQAYERFEKLLEKYPSGQFTERVLSREFDIGQAFLAGAKRQVAGVFYLSAQDEGEEILLKVVEHAPGSVIAERSVMTVADYHFQNAHWDEAVKAYDRYVELFKNSPNVPRAMLQAAIASYASYRGPEYEDVGLVEAQERLTLFKQRYPRQASQAEIDDMLAQVDAQRAQKLWDTAEFYRRTGQPRAEAYYYRHLVQHFGNTGFAARAKVGLESLGPLETPVPQREPLKGPANPLRVQALPAENASTNITNKTNDTNNGNAATGPSATQEAPSVSEGTTQPSPTTGPTSRSVESLAPSSQPATEPANDSTSQPVNRLTSQPTPKP